MNRKLVYPAACSALVALTLAATTAHAGDKGNSKRSAFSQSGGGGSNSSMKLHSTMSRNSGGNGMNSATLNNSFSKMSKSLNHSGQGSASSMLYSGKKRKQIDGLNSQITNSNLFTNPSFNPSGRARRAPTNDILNKSKLADAIQNGTFKPIDSGIGNGTDPQPGKIKPWDHKTFVDAIKHGGNFPGNGNGGGNGKDKDCHDSKCFPWWTIGIGGCYPHNYPNDCYDDHCHDHCHAPIYNVYPPVTNVTVVNPLPLEPPVQPALVDGVDLELLDLRLVDVGDPAKNLGPRYRITFRNRGLVPAGNFQVLLLASSDGTPKPGLPSGIAEIAGLAPGQSLTADVRLAMTPDLATLGALVVALDSATQIAEFEERNNVAVLDRTKIMLADLATTAIQ